MRIAYDHQVFAWQRHGGISRYFAELVRHLGRHGGLSPTVIAPIHFNTYLSSSEVCKYVRGWYRPSHFRGAITLNLALSPLFWVGSKFDVVHETYYSRVSRGRGRVRILTVHDTIHELFPEDFPDAAKVTTAKRAAVTRADHVICNSETTRRDAIRLLGVDPARSSVTYFGCSFDAPQLLPGERPEIAPCILYVGPRNGYKNFVVLLEAFAASYELKHKLQLVAFGAEPFGVDEQRAIERLSLTDHVLHVSGDDALLSRYYCAAVAFVYPSRYEGFGFPPLEAMAHGCPVACSGGGSISEVVGDAGCYFDPDDSHQLRQLLERLADDGKYADDLRARGFAQVRKYSWAKCAADTLAIYQQLAG